MSDAARIAIDVVLPVFNGSAFVTRALDSVCNQEPHPELGGWDLRIHVIDDASTDESGQVLADFAERVNDPDVHLRITTNETNRGVAHSRNVGIAAGTAPFVAFIDQDDEWVKSKLALQIAALEADASLGYAVGKQQLHVPPGESRPTWCRPEWLVQPVAGFLPSTLVVRREIFTHVGVFDASVVSGADDVDWFARARALDVLFFDEPSCVVQRLAHQGNASNDIDTSNTAMLDVVRRHLARKATQ